MIGHLDCSSGVSGDKFLGALLDAGSETGAFTAADLQAIATALAPEAEVSVGRVSTHGIDAATVQVTASQEPSHRAWRDIRARIAEADLPALVREGAIRAFGELASAEARVHGVQLDEVHFHEVGALDSIVDVVGVCAGIHALGISELVATPVATGWGTVASSHGSLPVPAPATALLLAGLPVVPGATGANGLAPGELTTPTGAALVKTFATSWGPCPPMTPRLIGYGAGTRDIGYPNICRLIAGDPSVTAVRMKRETIALLETNIDHISPEAAAIAAEQLLAEGALDVWITPAMMKKGRAAFTLSVLTAENDAATTASRIAALTGTLGVRVTEQPRFVAERESREIATPWGGVRVKIGAGRVRAEAADVERIALATSRAPEEVAATLERLAREQIDA